MRMCHIKANEERENIEKYSNDTNIKYMRDKAVVQDSKIISRSTNEIIRITDILV